MVAKLLVLAAATLINDSSFAAAVPSFLPAKKTQAAEGLTQGSSKSPSSSVERKVAVDKTPAPEVLPPAKEPQPEPPLPDSPTFLLSSEGKESTPSAVADKTPPSPTQDEPPPAEVLQVLPLLPESTPVAPAADNTPTQDALPPAEVLQAPPPLLESAVTLVADKTSSKGGPPQIANIEGKLQRDSKADMAKMESEMEQEVTNLVKSRDCKGNATSMKETVNVIGDLITNKMIPRVLEAHEASQKEVNTLMGELKHCTVARENSFDAAKDSKASYERTSPMHKSCRSLEAVLRTSSTSCTADLEDKKTIKRLKCKQFATVSKEVGDQHTMGQIIIKAFDESVDTYVRRISATICGKGHGIDTHSMLERYIEAKSVCEEATKDYNDMASYCKQKSTDYDNKKIECDALQEQMDGAACHRVVQVKDACESYSECYVGKLGSYETTQLVVQKEETDRKTEWRALKRMECLLDVVRDCKVKDEEVEACKKKEHDTNHLIITYPTIPRQEECDVPDYFPATAEYKRREFTPLPALAKGNLVANPCVGMTEISTVPNPGSPETCKCKRVALNGPYSAGPMVKCTGCLDIARSLQQNSCPEGTKLFSPRSQSDWKTIIHSVEPLRDPDWIVDITRPEDGCGGCTSHAMSSGVKEQESWVTSDGSAWWLRASSLDQPNLDYFANCYLSLWHQHQGLTLKDDDVSFAYGGCSYHSKSYFCQSVEISTTPKPGSPKECKCSKVELTGHYSAEILLMCQGCLDVHRTTQKNSCPKGTKIFAPGNREDWKTFIESAKPLKSPNFIIDITRPEPGCEGCITYPMNSDEPNVATWRTSDGSPWWLRSSTLVGGWPTGENGDYTANCYLDVAGVIDNPDSVRFASSKCDYHSTSYYCQPFTKADAGEEEWRG